MIPIANNVYSEITICVRFVLPNRKNLINQGSAFHSIQFLSSIVIISVNFESSISKTEVRDLSVSRLALLPAYTR
jgi:hypothetical protein